MRQRQLQPKMLVPGSKSFIRSVATAINKHNLLIPAGLKQKKMSAKKQTALFEEEHFEPIYAQ